MMQIYVEREREREGGDRMTGPKQQIHDLKTNKSKINFNFYVGKFSHEH